MKETKTRLESVKIHSFVKFVFVLILTIMTIVELIGEWKNLSIATRLIFIISEFVFCNVLILLSKDLFSSQSNNKYE